MEHVRRKRKRDLKTIKTFREEFDLLPSNWAWQVIDPMGHELRFSTRLTQLTDEIDPRTGTPYGKGYLRRLKKQWYKHRVYYCTEKGASLVGGDPLQPGENDHEAHKLLRNMVMASIHIGAREKGFELVRWPKLAKDGWTVDGEAKRVNDHIYNLPPRAKDCHYIPLSEGFLRGDGVPFMLRKDAMKRFILTMEIDRNTEHLDGASRNTIRKKFQHYKEVFDKKLWKDAHYGFPNSIVLVVTVDEERMHAMKKIAEEVLGPKRTGIVFYHWHDWFNARSFDPAQMGTTYDYIFTAAGKRIGAQDFKLCE
jgi:hypothetical protein